MPRWTPALRRSAAPMLALLLAGLSLTGTAFAAAPANGCFQVTP